MFTLILELLVVIVPSLVMHSVKKLGFLAGVGALIVMVGINITWQSLTGLGVLSVFIKEFFSYNFG